MKCVDLSTGLLILFVAFTVAAICHSSEWNEARIYKQLGPGSCEINIEKVLNYYELGGE